MQANCISDENPDQGYFLFESFFSSISKVAKSFFVFMEERLNYKMIEYEYWNGFNKIFESKLKIFKKPDQEGFTAVILTFDRFDSLIKVIKRCVTVYMHYQNNIIMFSFLI